MQHVAVVITKVDLPLPGTEDPWYGASIPAGTPGVYYPKRTTFDPLWCTTHGKGPLVVLCDLQVDLLEIGVHLEHHSLWDGKSLLDLGDDFGYFRPLLHARKPWPPRND